MPPKNTLLGLITGGKYSTSKDIPPLSTTGKITNENLKDLWAMLNPDVEYQGGMDDITANVAFSPLLSVKSILGSKKGAEFLKDIGLRNPLTHYTDANNVASILKDKTIRGIGNFLGKQFNGYPDEFTTAVSTTRNPKFLSQYHSYVGSDVGLVIDKDEMIKKGLKIKPFTEKGFRKTFKDDYTNVNNLEEVLGIPLSKRTSGGDMNPRFEFEERVRGYIPTENIKLIDLARFSNNESYYSDNTAKLIEALATTDIPIIKSPWAFKRLINTQIELHNGLKSKEFMQRAEMDGRNEKYFHNLQDNIVKLLETPTYKFDPFKKVEHLP